MPGSGRQRETSILTPQIQEIRELGRQSKDWFASEFLHIITKEAKLELIKFWQPQVQARQAREADRLAGIPIRHLYLKSRQVGMSTDCEADTFTEVYCNDNISGLIIAHDKPRAQAMLDKAHTFHNYLPYAYRLQLARSTTSTLKYAETNSGLSIMTAANFEAQRGGTYQVAHVTEFTYFPDARGLITGLNIVVPRIPQSQILVEFTAQGAGTDAHQYWLEAEAGENGYKAIFFNWKDDPMCWDYQARSELDWVEWLEKMFYDFPNLKGRQEEYGLTKEQISWYYGQLKQQGGDELKCRQEFPCSASEAWLASGTPIFDINVLNLYYERVQPGMVYDPLDGDGEVKRVENNCQKYKEARLNREEQTYLEVWQPPLEGRRYVIGADCAAGYEGRDFSSAFVLDAESLNMCAEFHGRLQPHEFAMILGTLGRYYNTAVIAPEVDLGSGIATLNTLKQFYYNIYRWRYLDDARNRPQNKQGWVTGPISREVMLANAKKNFLDRARDAGHMHMFIRSEPLIRELQTFCLNGKGKAEATSGHYDDRVIAWAIAITVAIQEMHHFLTAPVPKPDDPLADLKSKYSLGPDMKDAAEYAINGRWI
jgi:hypothetical protein